MANATLTLKKVLQAAKARIADDLDWGQRSDAQSMEGYPVAPMDPGACKWCLMGAIKYAAPDIVTDPIKAAHNRGLQETAVAALGFKNRWEVREFNDASTHAEILARLDAAIAAKPKRGSTAIRDNVLDDAGSKAEPAATSQRARRARVYRHQR